jgi:hypothetical protein
MHDALLGEQFVALTALIATCDTEQVLAEHQCTPTGKCTCSTPNVRREWPCVTRSAALRAHELVLASQPRVRRA